MGASWYCRLIHFVKFKCIITRVCQYIWVSSHKYATYYLSALVFSQLFLDHLILWELHGTVDPSIIQSAQWIIDDPILYQLGRFLAKDCVLLMIVCLLLCLIFFGIFCAHWNTWNRLLDLFNNILMMAIMMTIITIEQIL